MWEPEFESQESTRKLNITDYHPEGETRERNENHKELIVQLPDAGGNGQETLSQRR